MKVCMALFVCIAPINVRRKFVNFAPHMEGNHTDYLPHIERSHADFAWHIEWRQSFRDQQITKIAKKKFLKICSHTLSFGSFYNLSVYFWKYKYFKHFFLFKAYLGCGNIVIEGCSKIVA